MCNIKCLLLEPFRIHSFDTTEQRYNYSHAEKQPIPAQQQHSKPDTWNQATKTRLPYKTFPLPPQKTSSSYMYCDTEGQTGRNGRLGDNIGGNCGQSLILDKVYYSWK